MNQRLLPSPTLNYLIDQMLFRLHLLVLTNVFINRLVIVPVLNPYTVQVQLLLETRYPHLCHEVKKGFKYNLLSIYSLDWCFTPYSKMFHVYGDGQYYDDGKAGRVRRQSTTFPRLLLYLPENNMKGRHKSPTNE